MKINNNFLKKLICVLLLMISMSCMIMSVVNAQDSNFDFKEFENADQTPKDVSDLVENSSLTVISVMRIAGVTIAIVMILVIAIKYMVSSAGDRADIKKHAVAYVVGAFILFGAVGILTIIESFSQNIKATE